MGLFSGPSQKGNSLKKRVLIGLLPSLDIDRQQQKNLKSSVRDIEKEERALILQEQKLENEIKILAKKGQEQAARTLAKQLINTRQQKQKLMIMKAQLGSTSNQVKSMQTQQVLTNSLKASTSSMNLANKQMNLEQNQALMQAYEKESMKLSMSSEMMDDTFESVFEVDEDASSDLVNQVFDEVGLDFAHSVGSAPIKGKEKTAVTDADVESFLAQFEKQS